MLRFALAGSVLAVAALAFVLYATTRDEPGDEVEPPASEDYTIVNDGAEPARRLVIEGQNFGGVAVLENAPGCATPDQTAFSLFDATFEWPSACVEPGEAVVLRSAGDCPGCTGPITAWRWEE